LSQGFRSLPVLLSSSILVLGLVQANFNLLFFFVGLFIIAPLAALLANMGTEFIMSIWPFTNIDKIFWQASAASAEQCALFATPVLGSEMERAMAFTVVPSYWLTIMAFFFTYLFANAVNLEKAPTVEGAPEEAVRARKSQARVSMILVILVAIITTWLRYATTCETLFGVSMSWLIGGGLGYSWYSFMSSCGVGRLDDIFGIRNQLLPFQSYQDQQPTVCVPS
jgi:hypothetical protein